LPKEERDENQLTEWDEVLDDDEIEAGSISQSPIEISIKQVLIMYKSAMIHHTTP